MIFIVKPNTILCHCVANAVLICFDDQGSALTRCERDADAADGCVIIAFHHQKELRTTLQGPISLLAEWRKDILPTAGKFKPH